jgi:signal transduction histidine kinase
VRLKRNGETFPVMISGRGVRDAAGNISAVTMTLRDITDRIRAEQEVRRKHAELRSLAAGIEAAREGERKRIAREIHDELGQRLTVLDMSLSSLRNDISKGLQSQAPAILERIQSMQQVIETTIDWIGRISVELRPSILDNLGLTAAIRWQAQEFQTRTGVKCIFSRLPKDVALDADRSTAVFRIFQELLTNVARHAGATTVRIKLENTGRDLVLQVRDDGKGIPEDAITSSNSLGLLGIRERAEWLGGAVDIRGVAGAGTAVTLEIPLGQTASQAARAGK